MVCSWPILRAASRVFGRDEERKKLRPCPGATTSCWAKKMIPDVSADIIDIPHEAQGAFFGHVLGAMCYPTKRIIQLFTSIPS